MYAAISGQEDVLRDLCECGANVEESLPANGQTPLMHAASKGQTGL